MYRIAPIFIFLLGLGFVSYAQSLEYLEVRQDSLIQLLQTYRAEENLGPSALISTREEVLSRAKKDASTGTRVKTRGFRVQIYSGNSRNEAYDVQTRFQSQFKDYGSYISYEEPNYRVKVGDFTSRSEANRFRTILREYYRNVFVFTEDIWVYQ